MEFTCKDIDNEIGAPLKIIKEEVDCIGIMCKKEISYNSLKMKNGIDCDDMVIKKEADHIISIMTENGHHIFIKEGTVDKDRKKEANPVNIEMKKEDIDNIKAVKHDNRYIKQETNNFKVNSSYINFDISNGDTPGDILKKEEEFNFSYENSENISVNYSVDETTASSEEFFVDGSSVKEVYDVIHQKDRKVSEGNYTTRNRQRESQDTGNKNLYENQINVLENYQSFLKPTSSKDFLQREKHRDGTLFKCRYCDYSTPKNETLNRHVRIHTGEKPYKCSDCDYRASQKNHLKIHLNTHTGEKPFKCSDCDYSASRKDHLKNHFRIHTGEKPFKCTECDFNASLKSTIYNHMKTHTFNHTGEKPFKCSDCDYCALRKNELKIHMRTHTGEKPFKCSECDYRASQTSHLKDHIRIHTGERPFKCSDCDYRASQSSHLRDHIRTHTGEKPFKCSVCDYSASQKSSLNVHIKIHTGNKLYENE